MKHLLKPILVIMFLQGCATQYHKGSTRGYSETRLAENMFKVFFRGNGFTSRERASDFTLLRSAELTLQNGYKYFVVIDTKTFSNISTYTTPMRSHTHVNIYGDYGDATTVTSGGENYKISKPVSSNTILCFKDKPNSLFSYDAEFIYKSIIQKYKIKEKGYKKDE